MTSGWQPVETAPDMTDVLVFSPLVGVPLCAMMRNNAERTWHGFGQGLISDPTHWMPLPEPPQQANSEPTHADLKLAELFCEGAKAEYHRRGWSQTIRLPQYFAIIAGVKHVLAIAAGTQRAETPQSSSVPKGCQSGGEAASPNTSSSTGE